MSADKKGLWTAFGIIALFGVSLSWALTGVQIGGLGDVFRHLWLVLWMQLLYCGLFITAHDACHGSVAPGRPRINLWMGRLAAFLYAGFFFDTMRTQHHRHHEAPGSPQDPDYLGDPTGSARFFPWIWRFFRNYLGFGQLLFLFALGQFLMQKTNIPHANLQLFWIVPAILSALQLFYFGTYLPHRRIGGEDHSDHHHSRNASMSFLRSFLTCYHFGSHHHTHHLKPGVPWFGLPFVEKED
jgi:beta-carotene ketolase (CrtW type)